MRIAPIGLAALILIAAYSAAHSGGSGDSMVTERDAQIGQQITVRGKALNAKAGAVVVFADTGEPVYVRGLHSWPDKLHGTSIEVVGTLRRKMIPSPVVAAADAVSAGAEGKQLVLEGAPQWKRGMGRFIVVTGTARNAKAGPVIVTPIGPLYVHEAGDRWPEKLNGRTVTGIGRLQRNKRPATPENDDSEFGGKPGLTEEWAFRDALWSAD